MNIVHFTHGKVNPFGESGMSRTVYYLNKYQKLSGNNSRIWAVVDGVKQRETFRRDEFVSVEMFPRIISFNSPKSGIVDFIRQNRREIDIVHFHLMWMYDKNIVARTLKDLDIPYVVTPHGAYAKTSVMNMWWKKIPATYLYELNFLNNATAVHALCHEELSGLREYGVRSPIFIVPNGIEPDEIPKDLDPSYLRRVHDIPDSKLKLAWIGIIKPVKNLEGLISAAALLPLVIKEQVCFVIIGPDHRGYQNDLLSMARQKGVDSLFYFVGPKYKKDKFDALASANIYIHPSWSEGVSFAILDAMACGKPCILTRTSNMTYYLQEDFFCMVEPWPDDIARGIVEMVERRERLETMGTNSVNLIHRELQWSKVNKTMLDHYDRMIKSCE